MESAIGIVAGAILGYGAARLHRIFDGGWWLSFPLGALGGWLGANLWGEAFTPLVADARLAGIAVAGGVGGLVAGALSGPLRHLAGRLIGRGATSAS